MKRRFLTRVLCVALCGSVVTTQTACIGSFSLSKGVLDWNNSLGNKFVNWIVFFAFAAVQVYTISLFLDAFVFNSLEFWTGRNPVAGNENVEKTRRVALDDGFELLYNRVSADEMTVTIIEHGVVKQTLSMTMLEDGMIVRDGEGVVIARIQERDGEVEIFNALDEVLSTFTSAESAEVSEIYRREGATGMSAYVNERVHANYGVASR